MDINDNAPVFAIDYETLLCENAMPGQVRPRNVSAGGQASIVFFVPYIHLKFDLQRISKPLKLFLVPQNKSTVHRSSPQLGVIPRKLLNLYETHP